MSETVRYTGTFEWIGPESDETLEECCQQMCKIHKVDVPAGSDAVETVAESDELDEFFVADGKLWWMTSQKELDGGGYFCDVFVTGSTFRFSAQYYNGGACLEEVLDEGLRRLRESQDVN